MPPKATPGPRPRRRGARTTAKGPTAAAKAIAEDPIEAPPPAAVKAIAEDTIEAPSPAAVKSIAEDPIEALSPTAATTATTAATDIATVTGAAEDHSESEALENPEAACFVNPETAGKPSNTGNSPASPSSPKISAEYGSLSMDTATDCLSPGTASLATPEFTGIAFPEIVGRVNSAAACPVASADLIAETIPPSDSAASREKSVLEATQGKSNTSSAIGMEALPMSVGEIVEKTGQEPPGPKVVVKRIVRVVKKVVKKKVPKRARKGVIGCLNEGLDKGRIPTVSENPNADTPSIEEFENPSSTAPTIHTVSVSMPEVENLNPCIPASMEVENSNSNAVSMEVEKTNESKCRNGEKDGSVAGCSLEGCAADSTGDKEDDHVTQNLDSGDVGNCDGRGSSKGHSGMGEGVVVLSEEMEALERMKRRKTEIFIGGLDKDTKEEDVRKVFGEVGEVVEVRLMMKGQTGKNKGYAFLRYASAANAKKALDKYSKVEICGKQCGTSLVEGNDTIFLGNIDKKWKSEDVLKLLQGIGVEKIDKVTVMPDPTNIEGNRGFAFLELETIRDAQNAYKKLQKKDAFGKHLNVKVAWAEPLKEPDEEEMLKVKSVYVEYVPPSWDEAKVIDFFKKFGEVDSVVLARNLRSSKRKDFAFVNFTNREAALTCIESFSRELLDDDGSKVSVKVSLAKPFSKGKQNKQVTNSSGKEILKEKPKAAIQPVIKASAPKSTGRLTVSTRNDYQVMKVDRSSSTTNELVQILREQALWKQSQAELGFGGSVNVDNPYSLPERKRSFSALEDGPFYSVSRGHPRTHLESSFPAASPSYGTFSHGVDMTSLPYYQRHGTGYRSGYGFTDNANQFQTEDAPYLGNSSLYRRY